MTDVIPLATAIKMLRIALGYGSRTERITRLLNSPDPDVQLLARSLKVRGFLDQDAGTIRIRP